MPLIRHWRAAGAVVLVLAGFYLLTLVAVSLVSRERVLGLNEFKRFCGLYLDCHRQVAVGAVHRTERIGELRASGTFYVVTLRIASDAKRAPMSVGGLAASALDATGARYQRAEAAERTLALEGLAGLPQVAIPAGGEIQTRIVFDLPPDAQNPRLDVRDGHPLARLTELLLLGDEDSFLHARTTFALTERREAVRGGRLVCEAVRTCDTLVRVMDVRREVAAGKPHPVPADGIFYVVIAEVRSPFGSPRPGAALVVQVQDGKGRVYPRARDVEALLAAEAAEGPAVVQWVFDLPDRVARPRLVVRKPGLLNRWLTRGALLPLPDDRPRT